MDKLFATIREVLSELRRRNVYRVAGAYLVAGFVVLELADMAAGAFGLPGWFQPMIWVITGLGFPIALVLAWALEVTPEGVRPTPEAEGPLETDVSAPPVGPRDVWVGGSVLVLLLLGTWWLVGGLPTGTSSNTPSGGRSPTIDRSVVVLPFEVSGSGADEWRDGMVTMLSMNLDGAAGLRAIADRTVFAQWERQDSSAAGASLEEALQVARDLGSDYAIIGSAVQLGNELRLGAEVYRVSSRTSLGTATVHGSAERITALTDQLTRKVLGVLLKGNDERIPSVDLASITTSSLEALKAYLRGERHFRSGEYEKAVEDYEEAIRTDSTFALAFERLALSKVWLRQPEEAFFQRVYELREHLPARARRLQSAMYLWEIPDLGKRAADSLRHLTNVYPDDPRAWYYLGEVLRHENVPGGWPEADEAFQRAVELNPGVASYHYHLVDLAFSFHHDSSLTAKRIQAHPPGPGKQVFQQAQTLVFGSRSRRENVLAHLNTIPEHMIPLLDNTLEHPMDGALRSKVLSRVLQRDDLTSRRREILELKVLATGLRRGQVDTALSQLHEQQQEHPYSACTLILSEGLGISLPDSLLRARLHPSRIENGASPRKLMCAGLYLVENGRREELPALINRLREAGHEQGIPEMELHEMVQEVKGYRALRVGNLEQTTRLWGNSNEAGHWGAIQRGDLYRTLGELNRAEAWYLAAWSHPIVHERLGRLYQQMNRPERAAAAYQRFIAAWKNADPPLQPRVDQARERLRELTDEPARISAGTSTEGGRED